MYCFGFDLIRNYMLLYVSCFKYYIWSKVVRLLRLLLRLKYVYMVDEFRVDFILLIIRIYLRLLLSSSQHGKFFFLPVMIKIRRKIYTINCIIYSILLIIRVILITVYSRLSFRGNFIQIFSCVSRYLEEKST